MPLVVSRSVLRRMSRYLLGRLDRDTILLLRRIGRVLFSLFLFIFALLLLSHSVRVVQPEIRHWLSWAIHSSFSALGAGWIASSLLLNGSVVAAIAIALSEAGVLYDVQLFLLISGSRLGVAFFVLIIGGMEYLRGEESSLSEACSMGVLNFIITLTTYLPGILLGYMFFAIWEGPYIHLPSTGLTGVSFDALFRPMLEGILHVLPIWAAMVLAAALLFFSFKFFEGVFKGLDRRKIHSMFRGFNHRPFLSFAVGSLLTTVTASVSVSVGFIVPLYNRNLLPRRAMIPYIMGANISTLVDTLLAAIVLQSAAGVMSVLALMGGVALTVGVFLFFLSWYVNAVHSVMLRVVSSMKWFLVFLILPGICAVILLFL